MVISKRVYTKGDFAKLRPVPPSLWWAPADPRLHRRPSNTSGWFWFSLHGVTAPLLWVLVCTKFCLCPPRLESLFPPVLWKSYNQIPLALKARFPGDSQSQCQISRLGSLMWGSEPSQQWEYCSPVCGSPTWQVWDLSLSWLCPSYHFTAASLSLDVGYFFGGFQCPPRMMVVQQLVAVLVLLQEEMSTRPPTLPSCLDVEVLYIFWILTPH